jgi:hypothetical protein
MKKILLSLLLLITFSQLAQAKTTEFRIAHTRYQESNMVLIHVGANWFDQSLQVQEQWYTSLQSCVRSVNLAGTVIAVTNYNGGFKFYGPKSWHPFLRTIDMAWVNARKNKVMTCTF